MASVPMKFDVEGGWCGNRGDHSDVQPRSLELWPCTLAARPLSIYLLADDARAGSPAVLLWVLRAAFAATMSRLSQLQPPPEQHSKQFVL